MGALDPVAGRLGWGRVAVALVGGLVAAWGLFGVGAAVWYGVLPPGTFLLALLVVFLALVLLAPVPDQGPKQEPHPVWQRELENRKANDEWDVKNWPPDEDD